MNKPLTQLRSAQQQFSNSLTVTTSSPVVAVNNVDLDVMVDFFVSLFRLKYDNDAFRVCLNAQRSPYQLVLVMALYRIATQVSIDDYNCTKFQQRLSWWPRIELTYSRSQSMRNLFSETLNRVTHAQPVTYAPSGNVVLIVFILIYS